MAGKMDFYFFNLDPIKRELNLKQKIERSTGLCCNTVKHVRIKARI